MACYRTVTVWRCREEGSDTVDAGGGIGSGSTMWWRQAAITIECDMPRDVSSDIVVRTRSLFFFTTSLIAVINQPGSRTGRHCCCSEA